MYLLRSLNAPRWLWQPLNVLLFVMLFIALFEGIVAYIIPLLMVEMGFSKTQLGLFISSASLFGALFDFLLCRFFDKTDFRKMYLLMLFVGGLVLLLLNLSPGYFLFLVIMALWGLYYDLRNFGSWDYVAKCEPVSERSSSFSLIFVIKSAGAVIAPLVAGYLIADKVGIAPYKFALIFLIIAGMGYFVLALLTKNKCKNKKNKIPQNSFHAEFKKWNLLGRKIMPVVLMTFLLGMIDAFFWSVGPIFAESLESLEKFNGLFLTAFYLPIVFSVWFIKPLVKRIGKKRTSIFSVLAGSLILSFIAVFSDPFIIIAIVFLASGFFSIAWPANDGVYADFITETKSFENEVKGLGDFASNLGYIFGPAIAGLLMDFIGNGPTFGFLGVFGAFFSIVLLLITPKSIAVPKK